MYDESLYRNSEPHHAGNYRQTEGSDEQPATEDHTRPALFPKLLPGGIGYDPVAGVYVLIARRQHQ